MAVRHDPHLDHHEETDHDEEMPALHVSRRQLVAGVAFVLAALAFLYFALPKLADAEDSFSRIDEGHVGWLALAAGFSVLSFGGYVLVFRDVYVPGHRTPERLGFRESYQITMAGLAATRLFAAGGAGGVALTAWALRRSGMTRRAVADRTIAFLVLTYAVYMVALIVGGYGLRYGLFPGSEPFAMTVVPAVVAMVVLALAALMTFVPGDVEGRIARWARGHGRVAQVAARLSTVPATVSTGVRLALTHVRRLDRATIGAVAYWAFNIAILWACFKAYGESPPIAVVVMGYYVGMLGNLLPLPGGVGGVDGGMIGAFYAFGLGGEVIVVSVLSFRLFAFWLPTIPGIFAFLQLRRTVHRWREDARRPTAILSEA